MRNFQIIIFTWIRIYMEIFKSGLVCLSNLFTRSFNFASVFFKINIRNKFMNGTSWLVSHFIFTYNISLNKRRSKVQENNISCKRALNFDQRKTFSKNYKPMRVWVWLLYKIYRELLSLATFLPVHSSSKEVPYLFWPNTYPHLKTTCHIKLKIFLWTKLLETYLMQNISYLSQRL